LKRSNRLVLLIGIFLALVAFVLIILLFNNGGIGPTNPAASAAPTTARVVVATADIDLGATILPEQVGYKDIPIAERPANSYGDTSLVVGQTARAKVTNGQLITSVILFGGGNIQDIKVPKGYVAVSVQVDQVTGVGTIIKPGDFVDVITSIATPEKIALVTPDLSPAPGTYGYNKVPDELYNHTTVKTLSQGLQVLGTLLPPPPQSDQPQPTANGATTSGTNTTLNGQQEIVILSVPAQDAEVIKFAQIDGNISLVLRSSEDCTTKPADGLTYCPTVPTTGITLRRLVDDRGVLPPTVVQVIQPTPLPGTVPAKTPKP
jgi:Flp pilus assembly protein CpaB